MSISPLQTWLTMIFFILVLPSSKHTSIRQHNHQKTNYINKFENQIISSFSPDITSSKIVEKENKGNYYETNNKNIQTVIIIKSNESEKPSSQNFLTSVSYDNKTNKESTINININNAASQKEIESKDLTYMGDELFKNFTVVGGITSNNSIKFKVNNKDIAELSNDKSTNQTNDVEKTNGTLNITSDNSLNKDQAKVKSRNLKNAFQNIFATEKTNFIQNDKGMTVEKREIDDAVEHGLNELQDLIENREPLLYKLGFVLDNTHPAHGVANFGKPKNEKAATISKLGYALLEASKKLAQSYPENVSRSRAGFPDTLQSRVELDQCPFKGRPRCSPASRRFRTADGVCNNLEHPWRGAAMMPMQRFLPPVYEDGIQSIRRSIRGPELPSPRDISTVIHRDKNLEIDSVTLMFTQWGQFLDHDLTSAVKHLSFNGSTPRCCDTDGKGFLPLQFLHPACLPIEVPSDDPFLSIFGIRCMEFTRSSPSTRIDCDLGWREQINQVTPYIDASMIYGSDIDTMDSMRTFRNGKILYGRSNDQGPLNPPDPTDSELCRAGVITEDCMRPGDTRFSEQPGLIAIHTVFVRYHNKIATVLSKLNPHWSDERTFQETRKIVYSAIQHITYREYLPIVLGPQVMELFELRLLAKDYYTQYEPKVNPAVANAFGAAAFRFGHSMVQNSFIRTDPKHVPLVNNVSLHNEDNNPENIWSFGAVDRLLLGFSNQPSQRRDEFMAKELTNHLFQFSDAIPFGMDLAAINIQRGRDHGIPPYTFWRIPCGLSPLKSWQDLEKVMSIDVVNRLKSLYLDIDDVDLFTAGLAEKPLRGGVVGPTFACIIAQQFANLRRGDRFWYENGGFDSSFTLAQLQQIRQISFAQILCQTMNEIETIQPFVFLSPDNFKNSRIVCNGPEIRNFDLGVWAEKLSKFETNELFRNNLNRSKRSSKTAKRKPNTTTTTTKPKTNSDTNHFKITVTNITIQEQPTILTKNYQQLDNKRRVQYYELQDTDHNDVTYLFGLLPDNTTPKPQAPPVEVNIKIQYFAPTTTTTQKTVLIKHKPDTNYFVTKKRPNTSNYFNKGQTSKRPNIVSYSQDYDIPTKRPHVVTPDYGYSSTTYDSFYDQNYNKPSTYHDTDSDYDTYNAYKPSKRPTHPYNGYGIDDDSVVISNSYTNNRRPVTDKYNSIYSTNSYQTNKRPSINTYSDDSNPYVNNRQPIADIYNSYNSYRPTNDEIITYNLNRKPTIQNSYNRDRIDDTDSIQEQFFNNELTKRPIFGQPNFTVPYRIHSTTPRHDINDKLDFKSRLMDKDPLTDELNFVNIGSVQGEIKLNKRNAKGYVDRTHKKYLQEQGDDTENASLKE